MAELDDYLNVKLQMTFISHDINGIKQPSTLIIPEPNSRGNLKVSRLKTVMPIDLKCKRVLWRREPYLFRVARTNGRGGSFMS